MKRLLLVEEDPALASHWAETLREGGWEVIVAGDSAEALGRSGSFDVLFCEAELEGTSGLDLARRLRRSHPRLGVLLAAASAPERLPEDVRILMKPFAAERLLEAVEDLPAASRPVRRDRSPARPILAALLAAIAVLGGLWWTAREEPLPDPGRRESVLRGGDLQALAPRGDVERLGEMQWTPSAGAARYVVWIRRLDDSVVWQTSVAEPRVDLEAAVLAPGVPYRWEIEAFDAEGRRIGLSPPTDFQWTGEQR